MKSESSDRTIVLLGLLPLLSGAIWLLLLREPQPAAAESGAPQPSESAAEARLRPDSALLGVIVAGRAADLGGELSGQVAQVFVEPGARLREGEPILRLSAPSVAETAGIARAQYAQDRSAELAAELALETARDKAERMQAARDAYPSAELEAAHADARRAAAELARLQAGSARERAALRRELARADSRFLRAPFAGVLASRYVDLGDFVTSGRPLARVVDDARFVRFAVPALVRARLAPGASLVVRPADQSLPLTAALVALEPELDPGSGLRFGRAQLDAELARSRGLSPGQRVQVFLPEADSAADPAR